ncbi:hypothetical protein ABKN59_004891 [Abortiporus biennis]
MRKCPGILYLEGRAFTHTAANTRYDFLFHRKPSSKDRNEPKILWWIPLVLQRKLRKWCYQLTAATYDPTAESCLTRNSFLFGPMVFAYSGCYILTESILRSEAQPNSPTMHTKRETCLLLLPVGLIQNRRISMSTVSTSEFECGLDDTARGQGMFWKYGNLGEGSSTKSTFPVSRVSDSNIEVGGQSIKANNPSTVTAPTAGHGQLLLRWPGLPEEIRPTENNSRDFGEDVRPLISLQNPESFREDGGPFSDVGKPYFGVHF